MPVSYLDNYRLCKPRCLRSPCWFQTSRKPSRHCSSCTRITGSNDQPPLVLQTHNRSLWTSSIWFGQKWTPTGLLLHHQPPRVLFRSEFLHSDFSLHWCRYSVAKTQKRTRVHKYNNPALDRISKLFFIRRSNSLVRVWVGEYSEIWNRKRTTQSSWNGLRKPQLRRTIWDSHSQLPELISPIDMD